MEVLSTLPCFDGDEEGDAKSSTTTTKLKVLLFQLILQINLKNKPSTSETGGRTGDFSDGTGDLKGVRSTVSTLHCFDGVAEGDKTGGFVLVCFLGVSVDVTFAVSEIPGI